MDTLVKELRQKLPLKKTLHVGDVVVLAGDDPPFLAFAMVSSIDRDPGRRDEWWHVTMQVFGVPLQEMTWILRTEQMTGQETFTMGGKPRFMAPLHIEKKEGGAPGGNRNESEKRDRKQTTLRVVK